METKRRKTFDNFLVNILLLISGLVMVFSGLSLQLGYHRSGPVDNRLLFMECNTNQCGMSR